MTQSDAMSDMVEHPTGLEIRFERELAAEIPGWQSDVAHFESAGEPRPPRPAKKRTFPRVRPHPRKTKIPSPAAPK